MAVKGDVEREMAVLELVFERNPLPMWIHDQETLTFLKVNEATVARHGYSREELLQMRLADLSPAEDVPRLLTTLRAPSPTSECTAELRLILKSGEVRYVEMVSRELDYEGRPAALVVVHDVTERKRAEEAVRESESRFRDLFDEAPVGYQEVDAEGRIVRVNRTECVMLGFEEAELVGRHMWDLLEDPETGRQAFAILMADPSPVHPLELTYRRKDGSLLSTLTESRLLRNAQGEVLGRRATIQDITQLKRVEQALRIGAERFRELFDEAPVGYHELDTEGRIIRVNQTELAMLGYRAEEMIGRHTWDFVVEREESQRRFWLHLTTGMPGRAIDRTFIRKDGTLLPVFLEGKAMRDPVGRVIGRRVTIQDVTERNRLHQELAEREQRLQELVGRLLMAQEEERRRVAYEVHDGLAQLAASAHQHLQGYARFHQPRRVEARERLEQALRLMQRTVRETRRVIAGLRPTALDDFGLATALRLEIEALRTDGWQISFEESLGAERLPPTVETSLFRLAQEALVNVRKHAHTTVVELTLTRHDDLVRLEVRDSGCGFEPEEISVGVGPGERLGLAGMQERMVLLGGTLAIESRAGGGTRVTAEVRIPFFLERRVAQGA